MSSMKNASQRAQSLTRNRQLEDTASDSTPKPTLARSPAAATTTTTTCGYESHSTPVRPIVPEA